MHYQKLQSVTFVAGLIAFTACSKQETTSEPAPAPVESQQAVEPKQMLDQAKQVITEKIEAGKEELIANVKNSAEAELAKLKEQLGSQGDALISSLGNSNPNITSIAKNVVTQAMQNNESEALTQMKSVYDFGSSLLGENVMTSLNGFRDTLAVTALKKYFGDNQYAPLIDKAVQMLTGSSSNDSSILNSLKPIAEATGLSSNQSSLINSIMGVYQPSTMDQVNQATDGIKKGLKGLGF